MTQQAGAPATSAPAADEWGARGPRYPLRKRLVVVELLLLPALPVALVGFLLWGFAGLFAGLVLAIVSLLVWALVLRSPLRRLQPRPARPGEADRFQNLVEGLSRDLGAAPPKLLVIERDEPNAYVARRLGSEYVGVTTGLLATYPRTEQEAVAAHCVVRLRSTPVSFSTMAAATGKWAYAHAPVVGDADDLAAASVTRYPPALAAAIAKAGDSMDEAPLAFSSRAACHRTAEVRCDALSDL